MAGLYPSWSDLAFDFTGAYLPQVELFGVTFKYPPVFLGAHLQDASFDEVLFLDGAEFVQSRTCLLSLGGIEIVEGGFLYASRIVWPRAVT
jgi:hypothetical protein